MKRVVILGSTGSIGKNALDIVRRFPKEFKVVGLMTGGNTRLLNQQIREFKPLYVGIYEHTKAKEVEFRRKRVLTGEEALLRLTSLKEADYVIFAIPGIVGYKGFFQALKYKKKILLSTKEILVSFGEIIFRNSGNRRFIIPIDSEHSALWQCINSKDEYIKNIYLTCSGGPLWGYPLSKLKKVSIKEVLNHPRWRMGKKISVDSATLVNKGLEVIEAHYLFGINYERIRILIHREAIIHGLVEFIDSSFLAYLSYPDMRIPILYALTYPRRYQVDFLKLNLLEIKTLSFQEPDFHKFPALKIILEVAEKGGGYPCIINAANEVAVESFLKGKIKYLDLPKIIEKVVKKYKPQKIESLSQLVEIDSWARNYTVEVISKIR